MYCWDRAWRSPYDPGGAVDLTRALSNGGKVIEEFSN